ncbi:hypothetical protein O3P69_010675 [Scylla paramamosain]|uniref:Uncharacterized protein n=1 Tax=Scylla paramamosain TaxID=85552 RepID=A0AAW0TFJ6_SCYPA
MVWWHESMGVLVFNTPCIEHRQAASQRHEKAKNILGKSTCSAPTDKDGSPGMEPVSSVLGQFAVIPSESSNKTVADEAGTLRDLQQLPTVGPKTAMVISDFLLV